MMCTGKYIEFSNWLQNMIVSHSYQADTKAGGTREREVILDGNVLVNYRG